MTSDSLSGNRRGSSQLFLQTRLIHSKKTHRFTGPRTRTGYQRIRGPHTFKQIEIDMLRDQSSDRAKREADKAFKPAKTQKSMNDYAKEQHSFNENRERLKAERLAREAKPKARED